MCCDSECYAPCTFPHAQEKVNEDDDIHKEDLRNVKVELLSRNNH